MLLFLLAPSRAAHSTVAVQPDAWLISGHIFFAWVWITGCKGFCQVIYCFYLFLVRKPGPLCVPFLVELKWQEVTNKFLKHFNFHSKILKLYSQKVHGLSFRRQFNKDDSWTSCFFSSPCWLLQSPWHGIFQGPAGTTQPIPHIPWSSVACHHNPSLQLSQESFCWEVNYSGFIIMNVGNLLESNLKPVFLRNGKITGSPCLSVCFSFSVSECAALMFLALAWMFAVFSLSVDQLYFKVDAPL